MSFGLFIFATYVKKTMNKDKLTDYKAEATPSGGVLIGKRDGQTMIHNKGSLSGYLVGRTHAEGGIKAINKSTGQPLEMQGGEVVITAPAVSDTTKREFEGKMMTNREILSEINKRGGGVSFSDGGEIPTEMHFSGSSYAFGGKTLSDHEIAYEISKCGCEHESYNEGGKIDQMPISVKKKVYTADGERKITPVAISILTDYVNALPQTKELNTDSKGNYTKERQELHQKIINDFKDELICIQKDEPIAILMGGSPASGKSTFLKKYAPYLLKEEILKVDADEIRSMLPEYKGYNATQTHLETKDIVNTLLSDKTIGIPCKYDIIYDGTMNSTKSYLPLISLLKSLGYKIFIVYVDKVPEEVVKKRALERYKKSGRFVPMEIIDDFFSKGKTALEELKSKADGYMIIDGSNGDYNVLERKGIRLPKTRAYSKLGQPISKLEKMANGGSLTKGMSLKQIAKMHGVTLLELNRQVKMGLDAESEHTSKVTEQMRIVKDHLYENPNYYTLLKRAGLEKGGGIEKWKKLTEYNLIPALGTTEEYKSYVYKNAKIYYSKIDREWLLEINHKIIKGYPTLAVAKKRAEMMLLDTNNTDIRYAGGGLIAPNGNTSNLTPKQYKLVRTTEFKAWFGDWENTPENASKVVDENGEPMVVFHGTKNEFYEFDIKKQLIGWLGRGFYFSKNKIEAKDYGKILLKCFLNIRNPFIVEGDIVNTDGTVTWGVGREGEISKKYGSVNPSDISTTLKHFKNDGVMEGDMISCFYSNQIKLADGTNTTFDTNNTDIRYVSGGGIDSFLNYYLEELKDFLKNQNDINLKDDYTFFYKGENFKIEPIIVSNTSSIKEDSFVIYDSDDEIVGNIEFNPNSNKEFIANSQFFEWNNINFEDGGLNSNEYDVDYFEDYKKGGEVDYVTYKDKYNKKYNYDKNTSHDLEEISKDTGVSLKGLQQIYNKGIGAYKTNPSSVRPNVKSKEQWAMARVYSAVMGGKASNVDSNELKMNYGGNVKDSLVRDAKSGNSPSRDLNNYNDLIDVQADGAVGGDIGIYANGGRLGTSGLPLVDYIEIINGGSYLKNLKTKDKFYDFQSLKKRVAEEYKLLPSTPSNIYRGYIEVQAYDTEGNELVAPNTSISDMKNTVKNFNPYTGKPSDLEKSFAKSRPISFKKYDWSEWFSGKKSVPSTQSSNKLGSKLVTGLHISYINPTNNSLTYFFVDNASEFLYTLINLYKNSIKKIDYKLIIDGKIFDASVYELFLTDDPQDNWRTIDFRMNPNVTSVDDVVYRLNEQYNGLDLSQFKVSAGLNAIGQPNSATTSKVEIPDFDINFDKRIKNLPPVILGLLIIRALEQGIEITDYNLEQRMGTIQNQKDGKVFSFAKSQEGGGFWADISNGNFKEFKKLYGKYGEKVKDIKINTPTTTTKTLSKQDLESIKIKINSDYDLALKVVEKLEEFGFTDTYSVRKRIEDKDDIYAIYHGVTDFVGWFTDEVDFNYSDRKEIFPSDLGIGSSASSTTSTAGLVEIPDGLRNFNGKVLSLPNPILELLLFRAREQGVNQIGNISVLNIRGVIDVDGISFNFDESKEGFTFWDNIAKGDFKKFKELYGKYGEKVKDIVGTPSTPTTTTKTLSKQDLESIKIKINSDFDLALKVVEKLEEFGFTNTSGIKRKIKDKEQFHSIWRGTGSYVGWFEDEDSFNDSDKKEIFPSDLGINTSTTIAQTQTQTSQSNTPSNQDKKISNEYVADDSVLRKNYILGSASLRKDRDDLDALVKLLPSFNQSKFAVEKATILKEMARLQKKLDYKGYITSNEQVSKGSDLFTPQGLLNYYYTQATQNPTAELEPPCELPTPNGGKSKLPLGAYLNVRSSQFKKWFGDWEKAYETDNYVNCSKMIDEETKEPKIFYHGVRKYIPSFGQMSNMGAGVVRPYGSFEPPNFPASYFANNESYANFYGGIAENMPKPSDTYKPFIYKVFLSIKNPIVLLPLEFEVSYRDLIDYILVAYGVRLSPNNVLLEQLGNDMDKKHPMWIYIRRDIGLIEILKDYGYDALIQQGDIPVFDTNGQPIADRSKYIKDIEYLSFYPNQVKSATVKKSFYFNFFNDIRFKKGGYVRI